MKKITLLLCTVLLFSVYKTFSQATIQVVAPPAGQNFYYLDMPDGDVDRSYAQGCFLITANELSALLTQSVTSFGFKLFGGTGSSSPTGSMTIYLENTNDASYSKGTSFASAISGMISVYSGTAAVPSALGTSGLMFNLSTAFNYTGGGVYVAYDWAMSSAPASNSAFYYSSTVAVNAGASISSSLAALPSLTLSNVRPVCIFNAINTATNEAGVTNVVTPGTIAESIQNSYTVTAEVLNRSLNPLSNLSVTLNISGANTYSNVQVVPTLAPGATQTLSFAAFTPSALGMQTVAVSVPSDENAANNTIALRQEVTCNRSASYPYDTEFESSYGALGIGSMCLSHFNSSNSTTLAAVRVMVTDYSPWANPNTIHLYGVLRNSTGLIVATTNTVSWPTSPGTSGFQTFTYTQNQALAANTDYYIGLAQTDGDCVAYSEGPVQPGYFYYVLMNGTMFGALPNGCYAIEPIFKGPAVSAGSASVTACLGEQITLTASGANSYSWSAMANTISNPLAQSITLQPATNDVLTVTGNDLAGCSNSATIALNLSFCLGLEATAATKELSVHPNPAVSGHLQVSGLSGAALITVYNLLGEKVWSSSFVTQTAAIDLSGQPQGAYLMQISDAQNQLKTVKIVNQH